MTIPLEIIEDDKLDKYIKTPIKEMDAEYNLVSTKYRVSGAKKWDRWVHIVNRNRFNTKYFYDGDVNEQIIYRFNKDKDRYKTIRMKRFHKNGVLAEALYVDKKNIRRIKKWSKNGQIILYSKAQKIKGATRIYKIFEWEDNGKLKYYRFFGDMYSQKNPQDHEVIRDTLFDVEAENEKDVIENAYQSSQETTLDFMLAYVREGNLKAFEIFKKFMNPRMILNISHDNAILKMAATCNKPEILKYIRENFNLSAHDARSGGNYALRIASDKGFFLILRELVEGYGLTAEDLRINNGEPIRNMVLSSDKKDSLDALKYMREKVGLGSADVRVMDNYILRQAAKSGRVSILKELRGGYGLDVEDARTQNNYALRWAAKEGHLSVIRELKKFGLTKEDVKSSDNCVIKYCAINDLLYVWSKDVHQRIDKIKTGESPKLKIMKEIFDLTIEDFQCVDWDSVVNAWTKMMIEGNLSDNFDTKCRY